MALSAVSFFTKDYHPTMTQDILNSRTGVGAGLGTVVGFLFGGPLGGAIGAVVGGGIAHVSGDPQRGVMTPKRKLIYTRAMETIKDPGELEKLAAAFHGEGLVAEAILLRKRAALRKLPAQTKDMRRAAFRRAMSSDDADTIAQLAGAFESEGALDAAKALREHADAVRAAHAAGKSAKPMVGGNVEAFAEKLGKAIIHFGPDSAQTKTASRNLVAARGKTPTPALISATIKVAARELQVDAPRAAPPAEPIAIDATAAAAEGVSEVDTGAPEPTVVGPPAANLETESDSTEGPPAAGPDDEEPAPGTHPTDPAPAPDEGEEPPADPASAEAENIQEQSPEAEG